MLSNAAQPFLNHFITDTIRLKASPDRIVISLRSS